METVLKINVALVKSQRQKDIPFIHSLNNDLLSIYYILLNTMYYAVLLILWIIGTQG